jgi:RsiW-degrading membrane proteinase PrsW (M82 family)
MNKKSWFVRSKWFQILVGGIILFIITEQALRITGIPNLIPTVLLLGAFVVPLTFVAYFYGRERAIDRELHEEHSPLAAAGICFFIGGVLGVAAAATIEYATLHTMSIPALFGVGFIEELVKLIVPVIFFIRWQHRSEADGLLFGVASGMGFAALETMGYGLTVLIQSKGNIGAFEEVLFIRGLLSPAGHAAWTGFICAILWRERNRKGKIAINIVVLGSFVIAFILHGLWDIVNSLGGPTIIQMISMIAGNLVIAAVSLTLLLLRLREARRIPMRQA